MSHESGGVSAGGLFTGAFADWRSRFWSRQEFEVFDEEAELKRLRSHSHESIRPSINCSIGSESEAFHVFEDDNLNLMDEEPGDSPLDDVQMRFCTDHSGAEQSEYNSNEIYSSDGHTALNYTRLPYYGAGGDMVHSHGNAHGHGNGNAVRLGPNSDVDDFFAAEHGAFLQHPFPFQDEAFNTLDLRQSSAAQAQIEHDDIEGLPISNQHPDTYSSLRYHVPTNTMIRAPGPHVPLTLAAAGCPDNHHSSGESLSSNGDPEYDTYVVPVDDQLQRVNDNPVTEQVHQHEVGQDSAQRQAHTVGSEAYSPPTTPADGLEFVLSQHYEPIDSQNFTNQCPTSDNTVTSSSESVMRLTNFVSTEAEASTQAMNQTVTVTPPNNDSHVQQFTSQVESDHESLTNEARDGIGALGRFSSSAGKTSRPRRLTCSLNVIAALPFPSVGNRKCSEISDYSTDSEFPPTSAGKTLSNFAPSSTASSSYPTGECLFSPTDFYGIERFGSSSVDKRLSLNSSGANSTGLAGSGKVHMTFGGSHILKK